MDFDAIKCAADYIRARIGSEPETGIILGSGLGDALGSFELETVIDYADIPGFPVSTVSGHAGRFLLGRLHDRDIIIMQGRIHYYEGYTMEQVVMPVRVMGMLGIRSLLITNAAGGIDDDLNPGDIMIITDHISSFVPSPLNGANDERLGMRFPDMTEVYDKALSDRLERVMEELELTPKRGIYLQTTGPQYETPAEIRAYRMLGADAVGMSTACEAVAARHMGVRVAAFSTISNKAAGLGSPLSHKDVLDVGGRMSAAVIKIIDEYIKRV